MFPLQVNLSEEEEWRKLCTLHQINYVKWKEKMEEEEERNSYGNISNLVG